MRSIIQSEQKRACSRPHWRLFSLRLGWRPLCSFNALGIFTFREAPLRAYIHAPAPWSRSSLGVYFIFLSHSRDSCPSLTQQDCKDLPWSRRLSSWRLRINRNTQSPLKSCTFVGLSCLFKIRNTGVRSTVSQLADSLV